MGETHIMDDFFKHFFLSSAAKGIFKDKDMWGATVFSGVCAGLYAVGMGATVGINAMLGNAPTMSTFVSNYLFSVPSFIGGVFMIPAACFVGFFALEVALKAVVCAMALASTPPVMGYFIIKQKIQEKKFEKMFANLPTQDRLNLAKNQDIVQEALKHNSLPKLFEDEKMTWQEQYTLYKQVKPELVKSGNENQMKKIQNIIRARKRQKE